MTFLPVTWLQAELFSAVPTADAPANEPEPGSLDSLTWRKDKTMVEGLGFRGASQTGISESPCFRKTCLSKLLRACVRGDP